MTKSTESGEHKVVVEEGASLGPDGFNTQHQLGVQSINGWGEKAALSFSLAMFNERCLK